jgi:hypothetical protein
VAKATLKSKANEALCVILSKSNADQVLKALSSEKKGRLEGVLIDG